MITGERGLGARREVEDKNCALTSARLLLSAWRQGFPGNNAPFEVRTVGAGDDGACVARRSTRPRRSQQPRLFVDRNVTTWSDTRGSTGRVDHRLGSTCTRLSSGHPCNCLPNSSLLARAPPPPALPVPP